MSTRNDRTTKQARRLEELEKLYREEQLLRKRLHNAMEDMKGKIRVYCRVRPMLGFERERGQARCLRPRLPRSARRAAPTS